MNLQIARWGNSLALRIPAEIVRRFGLRSGDTLDAQITLDGALTIRAATWSRTAFAAELERARDAIAQGTSTVEAMRDAERY